jgi:predicted transcriptional regulator
MTMPPKRAERGEQAPALRKQGMSWNAIGKELGVSGSYISNCAADYASGKSKLPPRKTK